MTIIYTQVLNPYFAAVEGTVIPQLPKSTKFLCVQNRYDAPVVWWEVEPTTGDSTDFMVYCVGTDVEFEHVGDDKYLGTTQHRGGELVLHWYVAAKNV